MLLATGSSFDLVQFIRILCWILLPLFAIASLLTIFFHYRNKRRDRSVLAQADDAFLHASPELLGYTKGDGEYIFFDHSIAIGEYKKRLASNHAKFTALQHDYEKLATKYATIAAYTTSLMESKERSEETSANAPRYLAQEIDELATAYTTGRIELTNRFEYLSKNFQSLEQEHMVVVSQLQQSQIDALELHTIQNRLDRELKLSHDENKQLKSLLQEREIALTQISDTSLSQQQEVQMLQNNLDAANFANASLSASFIDQQLRVASLEEELAKMVVVSPAPELSAIVTGETEVSVSPVIDMTEYIKREAEEVLAQ